MLMRDQIDLLRAENAELKADNARLRAVIATLQKWLGKKSGVTMAQGVPQGG